MMSKPAKPMFAAPSRKLNDLWREWIELHTALDREMPGRLAEPFFSACSRTRCDKRILLVGKATDGEWKASSYTDHLLKPADDAIQERLRQSFEFAQDKGNGKAFWKFFGRLADANTGFGLGSVIWSNVAKIGAKRRNPSGRLLSAQADLAERTLRAEIKEYQPALTIFVTGDKPGLSGIIDRALGTSNCNWIKSEDVDTASNIRDVWWIQGPHAKLWTGHPQGKPRRETEYWLDKAQELIAS